MMARTAGQWDDRYKKMLLRMRVFFFNKPNRFRAFRYVSISVVTMKLGCKLADSNPNIISSSSNLSS